jgi:hypothetical protein
MPPICNIINILTEEAAVCMDVQKFIILILRVHEEFLKGVLLNFNQKFELHEFQFPHTNNSSALKMEVAHF